MKNLQRLACVRQQIDRLKLEAETIEADAIIEGLQILESNESVNGKNTIFSDENAKIVLQFRTRYDDKNPSVARLQEDCDREYKKLCETNTTEIVKVRSYITELSQLIEEAETKYSKLLNSPYLENLKKQQAIALKATEHKIANLAVYVK
jgi:hypothetical protein